MSNLMYIWHILSKKTKCCQTAIVLVLVVWGLLCISYSRDNKDATMNTGETRQRYSFLHYSIFMVTHVYLESTLNAYHLN